jgi:hypothetical protein
VNNDIPVTFSLPTCVQVNNDIPDDIKDETAMEQWNVNHYSFCENHYSYYNAFQKWADMTQEICEEAGAHKAIDAWLAPEWALKNALKNLPKLLKKLYENFT